MHSDGFLRDRYNGIIISSEAQLREIEQVHPTLAENWHITLESPYFHDLPDFSKYSFYALLGKTFSDGFRSINNPDEAILDRYNRDTFLVGEAADIYINDLHPKFFPDIEPFADWHNDFYRNDAYYQMLRYSRGEITLQELEEVVQGPMFCGKNTKAAWMHRFASEAGLKVAMLVFYGLREEQVIARSHQNPKYGNTQYFSIDAIPFGSPIDQVLEGKHGPIKVSNYKDIIDRLVRENYDFVQFDEASFCETADPIIDLRRALNANNAALSIYGINRNYRGLYLRNFRDKRVLGNARITYANSFIPFETPIDEHGNVMAGPEGTHTVRHLFFGVNSRLEKVFTFDPCAGYTYMSKDTDLVCRYRPARADNSPQVLLADEKDALKVLNKPGKRFEAAQRAWYLRRVAELHPAA